MYYKLLKYYGKSVEIVDLYGLALCVILLVIVVLLNAVEIFTRYFLAYSSPMSMELAVSLSSGMYFIGYMILLRRDDDVVMRFFFDRLGKRTQGLVETLTHLVIAAFMGVLVVKSIDLFILTNQMTHPVFPVRQSFTVLPVLVGGILCLYVAVYKLMADLDRRFGGRLGRESDQTEAKG